MADDYSIPLVDLVDDDDEDDEEATTVQFPCKILKQDIKNDEAQPKSDSILGSSPPLPIRLRPLNELLPNKIPDRNDCALRKSDNTEASSDDLMFVEQRTIRYLTSSEDGAAAAREIKCTTGKEGAEKALKPEVATDDSSKEANKVCDNEIVDLTEKSIAIGSPTEAPRENSKAIGSPTEAARENSKAIGSPTEAPSENSKAIVLPTEAARENSKAIGSPSEAPIENSKAIVSPTEAPSKNSKAIVPSEAPRENSKAIGLPTKAPSENSKTIGPNQHPPAHPVSTSGTGSDGANQLHELNQQKEAETMQTDNMLLSGNMIIPTDISFSPVRECYQQSLKSHSNCKSCRVAEQVSGCQPLCKTCPVFRLKCEGLLGDGKHILAKVGYKQRFEIHADLRNIYQKNKVQGLFPEKSSIV